MVTVQPTDDVHEGGVTFSFSRGAQILVVGLSPKQRLSNYASHPLVVMWDVSEMEGKKKLPARVELVVRLSGMCGKHIDALDALCKDTKAIVLNGHFRTGQAAKKVKAFLHPVPGRQVVEQRVNAAKVGERVASIMRSNIKYDAPDQGREMNRLAGLVRQCGTYVPKDLVEIIFKQVMARRPGPIELPAVPQVVYESPTLPQGTVGDPELVPQGNPSEPEVVALLSPLTDVEPVTGCALPTGENPPAETTVVSGPAFVMADVTQPLFGEACVMGNMTPLEKYSGTVVPLPDGSFRFPEKKSAFVPEAFGTGLPVQPKSKIELAVELLRAEAEHHRTLADALDILAAQYTKG